MHTSLRAMRYVFAEVLLKALVPCSPVFRVWKTGLPVRSAVLKPHAGHVDKGSHGVVATGPVSYAKS
ncbi:hypothetical protein DTO012A9_4026 [Penicillium roqueforti]|nr:hypothetical protein CBS147310_7399 [Penicillium roqueforti]KAI3246794.1 hypothetical protein DTO012A9_4026 [Penicillium roqueforti]